MCVHRSISIYPTQTTAWNISDDYIIQCDICHEIINDNISMDKLIEYIKTNNCKIESGFKYLPSYIFE
jgi:hypothetical protein